MGGLLVKVCPYPIDTAGFGPSEWQEHSNHRHEYELLPNWELSVSCWIWQQSFFDEHIHDEPVVSFSHLQFFDKVLLTVCDL